MAKSPILLKKLRSATNSYIITVTLISCSRIIKIIKKSYGFQAFLYWCPRWTTISCSFKYTESTATHLARPFACSRYPIIIGRNIARTHIQFLTRSRGPDADVSAGIVNNRIANLIGAGKSR